MRELHDRGDEHVEHLLLLLDTRVQETALDSEPGIVDKYVYLARTHELGDALDVRSIGEVRADYFRIDRVLPTQFISNRRESGLIPAHQHEIVLLGGQGSSESLTDS